MWNGTERSDGVSVVEIEACVWAIEPVDGCKRVTVCPCCALPMKSPRAAKLVADAMFPMTKTVAA